MVRHVSRDASASTTRATGAPHRCEASWRRWTEGLASSPAEKNSGGSPWPAFRLLADAKVEHSYATLNLMRGRRLADGVEPQVLRKCHSGLVFATLLVAVAVQAPAVAQDKAAVPSEIKLSTALGPAYAQGKAGEIWAALIRDRSAGRIAVKHFPGASLVQRDPAREFAALHDGEIDLAVGSSSVWSAQ